MALTIRRLGPGDQRVLASLAADDADFDVEGRGGPLEPLEPAAMRDYLTDPGVLHWIAEDDGLVVGDMYCHRLRKRAGASVEILLYEIGVRSEHRRRGIGRRLVDALTSWMKEHEVTEVWVLADNPDAVKFYRACGFDAHAPEAAVYMTRGLRP